MGADGDHVRQVLEILLPLIRSEPRLHAGDVTSLSYRGDPRGARIVFDLSVAGYPGPSREEDSWMRAERVDAPARRRRFPPRALPPA